MTLGAPTGVDVEALKAENEQLRSKCSDLEAKVEELTKKARGLSGPAPATPRLPNARRSEARPPRARRQRQRPDGRPSRAPCFAAPQLSDAGVAEY